MDVLLIARCSDAVIVRDVGIIRLNQACTKPAPCLVETDFAMDGIGGNTDDRDILKCVPDIAIVIDGTNDTESNLRNNKDRAECFSWTREIRSCS